MYLVRRLLFASLYLVVAAGLIHAVRVNPPASTHKQHAAEIVFEPNLGQWGDGAAQFGAHANTGPVLFTREFIRLGIPAGGVRPVGPVPLRQPESKPVPLRVARVDVRFAGANPMQFEAESRRESVSHYYWGKGSQRAENIPNYGRIRARNLYEGIDLVYYSAGGLLEYDLLLAPGANPTQIRLAFSGDVAAPKVNANGDLSIATSAGELLHRRPRAYQQSAGKQVALEAAFRLDTDGTVSIDVAAYDHSLPLRIDPAWVTNAGGANGNSGATGVMSLATGQSATGPVFVGGDTGSISLPNPTNNGCIGQHGFVQKFTTAGAAVYSTHLCDVKTVDSIATNFAGEVFATGLQVPTTDFINRAYVAKLNASGTLAWSELKGGKGSRGYGITVDPNTGASYAIGTAMNFAVTLANAPSCTGLAAPDIFVIKVNSDGSTGWSRCLGGSNFEYAGGVYVHGNNLYVVGTTSSADFPTTAGQDNTLGGGSDAFFTILNVQGSVLRSRYLGGSGFDAGVAVSGRENAYIAGYTDSPDLLPAGVPGADTSINGGLDGFLVRLDATATVIAGTYVGGAGIDYATAVFRSPASASIVHYAGVATAAPFGATAPFRSSPLGASDAFYGAFDGTNLSWIRGGLFGGNGQDTVRAVTSSPDNALVFAGGLTEATAGWQFPSLTPGENFLASLF